MFYGIFYPWWLVKEKLEYFINKKIPKYLCRYSKYVCIVI